MCEVNLVIVHAGSWVFEVAEVVHKIPSASLSGDPGVALSQPHMVPCFSSVVTCFPLSSR